MTGMKMLELWSPPDGVGQAVACLATTFTFEADFFAQDCLARFLSLSTVSGEGDAISSIAALLEEENRLGEAQVSVLVDRSSPAEKRNLRWDVLPVAVPAGLLHAKVAVLMWERMTRIILGSANLTSAGYRRQVELALAIDLDESCRIPRRVVSDLVSEIRHLAGLVPGSASGPKGRALATIDQLAARVESLELPTQSSGELRLAVAPARPGVNPLDRLPDAWRGGQPLHATVLSPFWDDSVPAPAIAAVQQCLKDRPPRARTLTLVAAVDPFTGAVQAPPSLAAHGANVMLFDPPDNELRRLHAKLLVIHSAGWVAALIGSSNLTEAGFGLNAHRGHHELNLWIGCPAGSRTAKSLLALSRIGDKLELGDERWEPVPDEDEPTAPRLPLGFVTCVVVAGTPGQALLEFKLDALPVSWEVRAPGGQPLLSHEGWRQSGSPRSTVVGLPEEVLPAYLMVRWDSGDESCEATWTANVEDPCALPLPAELAELPVEVLLAALASTRPLPVALEDELRRRKRRKGDGVPELDPLRRFDDSGLLLQRVRHLSLALWRMREALGRPTTSMEALHWRLHGAFGPIAIADGLVSAAREQRTLPGEAHFLLAELALTVAAVPWKQITAEVNWTSVRGMVTDALHDIQEREEALGPAPDASLGGYIRDALEAARI